MSFQSKLAIAITVVVAVWVGLFVAIIVCASAASISSAGLWSTEPDCLLYTSHGGTLVFRIDSPYGGSANSTAGRGNFTCGDTLNLTTFGTSAGEYALRVDDGGVHPNEIQLYEIPYMIQGGVYYASSTTDIVQTATRIVTLVPLLNSTVATTSDIGATVQIKEADYVAGSILKIQISNQTQNTSLSFSALDAFNSATGVGNEEIDIPITSSGVATYSTTTTYTFGGLWNARYSIVVPDSTFLGSIPLVGSLFQTPATLVSSSSAFVVGTTTPLDRAIALGQSSVAHYALTGEVSTSTAFEQSCAPFSQTWSVVACMTGLIIPSSDQMGSTIKLAADGFMARYPWGYVTRFFVIMVAPGTSTLPTVGMTFPTSSAIPASISGMSFNFDPFSAFSSSSPLMTVVSPDGHTFLDEFTVLWDTIILSLTAFALVHLLIKHEKPGAPEKHGVTRDEYAYKEKLYAMSQRKK